MDVDRDLLGKTITGVFAARKSAGEVARIWMLQFSDGSHVEFVSPGARRGLRLAATRNAKAKPPPAERQLSLNVG